MAKSVVRGVRRHLGYSDEMARAVKQDVAAWQRVRRGAVRRRAGLFEGIGIVETSSGRRELVGIEVPRAGRGEVTIEVGSSILSPDGELRAADAAAFPSGSLASVASAGVVIEVGSWVRSVREGDRVALVGGRHASVLTVSAKAVSTVPDGASFADAALGAVAAVASRAIQTAAIRPGEAVIVLVAGPVGLLAQDLVRSSRAESVFVVASTPELAALAESRGADAAGVGSEFEKIVVGERVAVVVCAAADPRLLGAAAPTLADDGRLVFVLPGAARAHPALVAVVPDGIAVIEPRPVEPSAPSDSRPPGAQPTAEIADALAEVGGRVGDLYRGVRDLREPELLRRALWADAGTRGVCLDWQVIPRAVRIRNGKLFRIPDLFPRGLDLEGKALPAPASPTLRRGVEGASARGLDQLGVGLLGCGDIGMVNAAAIAAAGATRLVAAYDPATPLADEVTSRFRGTTARSADELIENSDVDVVFVATPHYLHAQLAVQAARAGRHVLVEKPLAVDLEQALRVADAADEYGVTVSLCLPYRYAPHVVEARRLVREGALGRFAGASLVYLVDKPPSYWSTGYSGRAVSDWRGSREKAGGGVLMMNLSHYLDALRYLVNGEVESVSAHVGSVDQVPGIDVEDSAALTLRFDSGAIAAVVGCAACRGASRLEFAIWGEAGHISVESPSRAYSLRAIDDLIAGRWRSLPKRSATTDVRERMALLDSFAAAVRDGRQPDIPVSDGIAVQALLEAAYRSSRERRPASPVDILREAEARAGSGAPD